MEILEIKERRINGRSLETLCFSFLEKVELKMQVSSLDHQWFIIVKINFVWWESCT